MERDNNSAEMRGIMKKNKVWLIAVVFCLMIITTVCYLASLRNTRTEYANGRVVERTYDEEPDIPYGFCTLKFAILLSHLLPLMPQTGFITCN